MSSSTRTGGPCPKCQGRGQLDEFGIGLMVVCDTCAGSLDEREHLGEEAEPQRGAVWTHPAVSSLSVCHVCLGTGVVANLGGTGEPTGKLVEMPCPACSRPDQPADEDRPH